MSIKNFRYDAGHYCDPAQDFHYWEVLPDATLRFPVHALIDVLISCVPMTPPPSFEDELLALTPHCATVAWAWDEGRNYLTLRIWFGADRETCNKLLLPLMQRLQQIPR